MKQSIFMLFILVSVFSCKRENSIENEISTIQIDYIIERFDIAFGNADENNLQDLKQAYPFMFYEKYPDSFWIAKVRDTLQQELASETSNVFSEMKEEKKEITKLFQHLTYYFPEFKTPRVITTTSSVDYRNKVIVTDTIVLISLDTYLGSEHKFYNGIQNYLKQDFNKEQIVVDLASSYADRYIFQNQNKTLLDEMIYFGKQLYFKDLMIPFKTDAEKIGYSEEQLAWVKSNEIEIWRFFVEDEILFSTDSKLPNRFINPAPFSKFYLEEIDKESPGEVGKYIGWQIVRDYMEKNEKTLKDLLLTDPEDIFNNSNYKPKR